MVEKVIILASGSPRRSQLLKEAGFDFTVKVPKVKEVVPEELSPKEFAIHNAKLKAMSIEEIANNEVVIGADTVVSFYNKILGKPGSREDAYAMLRMLSGKKHEVITGVCLAAHQKTHSFSVSTNVYFGVLTDEAIYRYIDNYKPFDKAGGYGIQEWIGLTAIQRIEGCYFNVVGLPVNRLCEELTKF